MQFWRDDRSRIEVEALTPETSVLALAQHIMGIETQEGMPEGQKMFVDVWREEEGKERHRYRIILYLWES